MVRQRGARRAGTRHRVQGKTREQLNIPIPELTWGTRRVWAKRSAKSPKHEVADARLGVAEARLWVGAISSEVGDQWGGHRGERYGI